MIKEMIEETNLDTLTSILSCKEVILSKHNWDNYIHEINHTCAFGKNIRACIYDIKIDITDENGVRIQRCDRIKGAIFDMLKFTREKPLAIYKNKSVDIQVQHCEKFILTIKWSQMSIST